MEQTKNEPKIENKAAPDNGRPKKERKPLTEAQRLKRQKMIVLALYTFGKAVYEIGRNDGSRMVTDHAGQVRSEERRVGKECRSRWSPYH